MAGDRVLIKLKKFAIHCNKYLAINFFPDTKICSFIRIQKNRSNESLDSNKLTKNDTCNTTSTGSCWFA